jgi:hypothetical protein
MRPEILIAIASLCGQPTTYTYIYTGRYYHEDVTACQKYYIMCFEEKLKDKKLPPDPHQGSYLAACVKEKK